MTVYIDDRYRITPTERSRAIADNTYELVGMASHCGLAGRVVCGSDPNDDHLDVPLVCRHRLLSAGAIEITLRQFSLMSSRRRTTGKLGTPEEAEAWFSAIYEAQVARSLGVVQ